MSLVEWIKGSLGDFAGVEQQLPVPVTAIPNDYPPPAWRRGVVGMGLAAGGAGLRTQCLLTAPVGSPPGSVVYIRRIGIKAITAGAEFEIVQPTAALTGFTNLPSQSMDLRTRSQALVISQKNSGAADPGIVLADNLWGPVNNDNNQYAVYEVNIILLVQKTGFDKNKVLVRPNGDNVGMYCFAEYWEWRVRKL